MTYDSTQDFINDLAELRRRIRATLVEIPPTAWTPAEALRLLRVLQDTRSSHRQQRRLRVVR